MLSSRCLGWAGLVLVCLPRCLLADTLIFEAEEFEPASRVWQRKRWGENYYTATFGNTFLSRKAFLGAPEQCDPATAVLEVNISKPGKYLALVRYEAAYRFETRFQLKIDQGDATKLNRGYGTRNNLKIWAFGKRLTNEVAWAWGAAENIVWEGNDAVVDLESGPARLTLITGEQPEPAAQRNIDVVMLTSELDEVKERIAKDGYLPLDGMLTQTGDLYVRGRGDGELTIPNGTEHSPYWVHKRQWQPKRLALVPYKEPFRWSDWEEVGSLLDTLNDGQWLLTERSRQGSAKYSLQFAIPVPSGGFEIIRTFDDLSGSLALAYDADARESRRIRRQEDVLYELVHALKRETVHGKPPARTLIYGHTFSEKPGDAKYSAALNEFQSLIGATALFPSGGDQMPMDGMVRGHIDVRDQTVEQIEKTCRKLVAEKKADRIAIVSLGDEIGLPSPPKDSDEAFQEWAKSKGYKTEELEKHETYYWKLYRYHYGIQALKEKTDILRKWLPRALIGANFSPHHGEFYLGQTHKWVTLFREGGMTMPWSEDYIFQIPVGSQQMNFLSLDLFRAGIRSHPAAKIHFYVMPHWPGNTPESWRRQFYGDIAHGAKIFNLFEFRPVQAAYTENHVSHPDMYREIRESLHELGLFEDIVQDGVLPTGVAALWFSETGDIWNCSRAPFAAAKRTLYIAVRHQQLPLDVVTEGDPLEKYQVLYLTDTHVSKSASRAIRDWVKTGGRLLATAGAGMFDEFNEPNKVFQDLLGIEQLKVVEEGEPVRFEKQDLPFATPIETVTWRSNAIPVFSLYAQIKTNSVKTMGRFSDGRIAITQKDNSEGSAFYCAFLPGLSYFQPAMPLRPVDRGSRNDCLAHFIPTEFDKYAYQLIGSVVEFERPVTASEPLVETTMIQAPQGMVIPLINWSGEPIKKLELTLNVPVPTRQVSLASGNKVRMYRQYGKVAFSLPLEVADALILR
jgi:hypothetical protein